MAASAKFKGGKPVKGIAECIKVSSSEVTASSLHQNNLKLTLQLEDYRKLGSGNKIKDLRTHFSDKDLVYFQVVCTPEHQTVQEFYRISSVRENIRAKFTSIQSSKAFLASQDVPSIFLPGSTPRHGLQSITDLTVLFKVGDKIFVDFAYLKDDRTLSYELRLPPLGKAPGICLGLVCDTGLDYGYVWNHEMGYIHFQQPKDPAGKFSEGTRVKFQARERPEVNNCKFEVVEGTLVKHSFTLDFGGIVPPPPIHRPIVAPSPPVPPIPPVSSGLDLLLGKGPAQLGNLQPELNGILNLNSTANVVNGHGPGPIGHVLSPLSPPPGINGVPSSAATLFEKFNLGTTTGACYKDISWQLNQSLDLRSRMDSGSGLSTIASQITSQSSPSINGFGAVGDGAPKKGSIGSVGLGLPATPVSPIGKPIGMNGFGGKGSGLPEPPLSNGLSTFEFEDAATQTEPLKFEATLKKLLEDDEILQIVSARFPWVLRELLNSK